MTQAPTPGPLSGDDVNRECKACGAFKAERDAACTFCGLAPTAPVEASGSEREHGPKCWGKTSASDEMAHCYCGSTDLRPQPSGETREQCAACSRGEVTHFSTDDGFWVEITTSAGGANEHGLNGWFETLEHYPDGSAKRREYVATDSPALSATPARAEAQDEGAAGEASAYRVRMISNDPAEWVLMHPEKALDFLSRKGWESQPLYAHPFPTPAADADRVRIAVEALEKARDRINVTRGPMGSFYRTESSAEALYEAKVAVGIGLSALKSTAAKEGEK